MPVKPSRRFFTNASDKLKITFRAKLAHDASRLDVWVRKYEDYLRKDRANRRGLTLIRRDYVLKNSAPTNLWESNYEPKPTYTTYLWLDSTDNQLKFKIYNGPDDEVESGIIEDEKTKSAYFAWKKTEDESYKETNEILLIIRKKEEEKALLLLKNELYRSFILREKVEEFLDPMSMRQAAEFEASSDRSSVGAVAGFMGLIAIISYFTISGIAKPLFSIILSAASTALLAFRRFAYNGPEIDNALNQNWNKHAKTKLNTVGVALGITALIVSTLKYITYTASTINKYIPFTSVRYLLSKAGAASVIGYTGVAMIGMILSMPVIIAAYGAGRLFNNIGHMWRHFQVLRSIPKYAVSTEKPKTALKTKTLYLEVSNDTIQYRVRPTYKVEYLSKMDYPNTNSPPIELLKHQSLYFWKNTQNAVRYSVVNPSNHAEILTDSLYSLFELQELTTNPSNDAQIQLAIKKLPKLYQDIIKKLEDHEEKHSLTREETDALNTLILKKHAQLNNLITERLAPADIDFEFNLDAYITLFWMIKNNLKSGTLLEQLKKLNIPLEHYSKLYKTIHANPNFTLEDLPSFIKELKYQELAKRIGSQEKLTSSEEKLIQAAASQKGHPYILPIEERERFRTQLNKRAIQSVGFAATIALGVLLLGGFIGLNVATFGAPLIGMAAVGLAVICVATASAIYTTAREYEPFKTWFRKEVKIPYTKINLGSHLEKITARFHKLAKQTPIEKVAGYIHDPNNSLESTKQKKERYGCSVKSVQSSASLTIEQRTKRQQEEKVKRFKSLNINPDGADLVIVAPTSSEFESIDNYLKNITLAETFISGYILVKNPNDTEELSLYFYDRTQASNPFVHIHTEKPNGDSSVSSLLSPLLKNQHGKLRSVFSTARDFPSPAPVGASSPAGRGIRTEKTAVHRLSYEELKQLRLKKLAVPNETQLFPHIHFGSVKNIWGERKFAQHTHLGGMNTDLNLIFNPNAAEPDSRKGFYDTDFISTTAGEDDFLNNITDPQKNKLKITQQKTIAKEVITKILIRLENEKEALEQRKIFISNLANNPYVFDFANFRRKREIAQLNKRIAQLKSGIKILGAINTSIENNSKANTEPFTLSAAIKTEIFVETKNIEKQISLAKLNGITKEEQENIKIERQATALIFLIGKIQDKRGALLQKMIDLKYNPNDKESFFSSPFSESKKTRFDKLLKKEQLHQCLLLLLLGEPIYTNQYQALFPNHQSDSETTPTTIETIQELDEYFWQPENKAVKERVFNSRDKVSNAHAMLEAVNLYFRECPPNKEKTQLALDKMGELIEEASESTSVKVAKTMCSSPINLSLSNRTTEVDLFQKSDSQLSTDTVDNLLNESAPPKIQTAFFQPVSPASSPLVSPVGFSLSNPNTPKRKTNNPD